MLGRRYGYHRCWDKECGAVQMRSERLEEVFGELLRRVQLAPGMVRLVEAARCSGRSSGRDQPRKPPR
jgi:hypothetical protein